MQTPRALPGVQPLTEPWIRIDEVYAAQMARRRSLIRDHLSDVYRTEPGADAACVEVLSEALKFLPDLGFEVRRTHVRCPDGVEVTLDGPPLLALGQMIQSDVCILEKRGAEHVLNAACLCFPAGWHLDEKIGRPLVRIHTPVDAYTPGIAARVQRMFDGVQAERPLWRFNQLTYSIPELHQPRRESDPRPRPSAGDEVYIRSERQSIVRMPKTRAVVFAIHTYVVRSP